MTEKFSHDATNEVADQEIVSNVVEATETHDDVEVSQTSEQAPPPPENTLTLFLGGKSFNTLNPTANSRGGSNTPSISIVCTHRNGKRISVSNKLFDLLGKPSVLAVACTENQLALGSELPMESQQYPFSKDKYSNIIYRSDLVLEIVRHFGLNFDGVSSRSFSNIKMDSFTNADGVSIPVAIVTMK